MLKIGIILNCMLFVDILLARFVLTADNVRYVQKIQPEYQQRFLSSSLFHGMRIFSVVDHNQYIILL